MAFKKCMLSAVLLILPILCKALAYKGDNQVFDAALDDWSGYDEGNGPGYWDPIDDKLAVKNDYIPSIDDDQQPDSDVEDEVVETTPLPKIKKSKKVKDSKIVEKEVKLINEEVENPVDSPKETEYKYGEISKYFPNLLDRIKNSFRSSDDTVEPSEQDPVDAEPTTKSSNRKQKNRKVNAEETPTAVEDSTTEFSAEELAPTSKGKPKKSDKRLKQDIVTEAPLPVDDDTVDDKSEPELNDKLWFLEGEKNAKNDNKSSDENDDVINVEPVKETLIVSSEELDSNSSDDVPQGDQPFVDEINDDESDSSDENDGVINVAEQVPIEDVIKNEEPSSEELDTKESDEQPQGDQPIVGGIEDSESDDESSDENDGVINAVNETPIVTVEPIKKSEDLSSEELDTKESDEQPQGDQPIVEDESESDDDSQSEENNGANETSNVKIMDGEQLDTNESYDQPGDNDEIINDTVEVATNEIPIEDPNQNTNGQPINDEDLGDDQPQADQPIPDLEADNSSGISFECEDCIGSKEVKSAPPADEEPYDIFDASSSEEEGGFWNFLFGWMG